MRDIRAARELTLIWMLIVMRTNRWLITWWRNVTGHKEVVVSIGDILVVCHVAEEGIITRETPGNHQQVATKI